MQSAVVTHAVGAVVGGEFGPVVVEDLAQDTLATDREGLFAVLAAPGTTLARQLDLLGQRTMQHWTRLFGALQPTLLALTLETGILTRRHLTSLEHRLSVIFASCRDIFVKAIEPRVNVKLDSPAQVGQHWPESASGCWGR